MTVCGFYLLTLLAVLGYRNDVGAQLDGSCTDGSDCTDDADCKDAGVCACSLGYYKDGSTCKQKKEYGSPCSEDEECNVSKGGNSQCVIIATGNKKCLCSDKLYWTGAQCQDLNTLKPTLTLSNPGQRTVDAIWTAKGASNYNSSYTLNWKSPSGSPGPSYNTYGESYTIPALAPGTTYTVSITRTITEKTQGRIQNVSGDDQTETTRAPFGDFCNNTVLCDVIDSNIQCTQTTKPGTKRCLCKDGRYRPSQSCVKIGPFLSPNFTGPRTLGTNSISVTWTAPSAYGYTDMYELTISPGGSLVHYSTGQETYNFGNLTQGTAYNVTLVRTITRHERSQSLPAVYKVYRTKVGYNQPCTPDTPDPCFDTDASCQDSTCRCDQGFYRKDTRCASIDGLKPTSVSVTVDNTTTMTAKWVSPSDTVVTGYEVTVTPGNINQITVRRDIWTTPITGLTPGRQYYVSVKTKITYLQGRDEETSDVFAQPKVTTPDTVDALGDKTNLTAPNIIIDFLKADGDVQYYRVQLQGITDGSYLETMSVAPPATNTTFIGVVSNYKYTLTITAHSNQKQSTPYTRTIRVRASQAGTVNYFKTLELTSRSVSVSWKRPVKTNENLFEYRMEVANRTCKQLIVFNCTECKRNTSMEASGNCEHSTVVHLSESDINDATHVVNYTITGLLPDTTYVVKVAAYNQDGRGIESSLSETTDEEAASEPTAFTANNKTSYTITLTWAPPEPRPGRTHYNIRVYEKIENTPDYNYIGTKNITGYRHNMYTVNNLSSAWEYKFYIQAFTLKGGSGNVSSDVVMTEESVSSFDQTILSVRPGGGSVGTNVIPLEICAECLYANGNIVKSGLLVCKVGDCQIRNKIHDARGDSYDRLPNWHSARGSGFTSMYRATADDWMSGKERDDIVLYTVGGETCEIADQTRFCNGPLLTENSYRVWVFACTNVGCMETLFVEVAVTEAYDVGAVVGAVVGGVVGVIVFAVIVFVAVVVYVKVNRKYRSKKNQDSINLGPTQKFDDTYDEVGDGQRMHAITESSSNDGGYVNQASGLSPDGFDSTYEQLATYQNAEIHDYGQINVKTRNKGAKKKR